ncbi:MAG: ferric reductase-like transmembrane domain-containing protein [Burkholderiaceae bacterium]|jgi:predicted ferric reductase|nr:ferric reductase-like transmembrane domain-containing protein [Burkholderiaceae bacterium]
MRNLKRAFWGALILLAVLWFALEPTVFQTSTFFALRDPMIQLTGVIAFGCMSLGMILALRPRWPEKWLGGLDKMYRMHKWLGIAALTAGTIHWLWAQGAKWAVGWGWLERPARGGTRAAITDPVEAFFRSYRGTAEHIGEWAFYAAALLIALALITRFSYRWFYKTHRLIALAYLALAFHALMLLKFNYWLTPLGALMALLLAAGVWSAIVVLLRRVGAARKVPGQIVSLRYFPGVRALEIETEAQGWPGHRPGQFAFATSSEQEGAHPYTIASGWHAEHPRIRFVVKELGDHTERLRDKLRIGQPVTLEGPYGCFTFDDDRPHQIWIGGGIGITPFIARMGHMATRKDDARDWPQGQQVDLFHSTSDVDQDALDKLAADAQSAEVRFHVLIDARHGRLTGQRIREQVPAWREASIWFCGPAGFGQALKRDFAAHGFPVEERFHQELFAMR